MSSRISKVFADRLSDLIEAARQKGSDYRKISAEIGISIGALSNYANDQQQPNITKLVTIAKYFNVSTDFLLGLTDEPSTTPAAVDDLHISAKAIKQLRFFTCGENKADELSLLMEDRLFWSVIREIIDFKKASIAEGIYDSIRLKYYVSDKNSCIEEMQAEEKLEQELSAAVRNDDIDITVRRYLSSLVYLNNLNDTDGLFTDGAYIRNFWPSEIHEQRANKYMHLLLERVNPQDPVHDLRKVYMEASRAGHIYYDNHGEIHYSSRKQSGDK